MLISVAIISMSSCVTLAELTNSLYGEFISRVIIPEFNKINVIKELLSVKHKFASVSVLDMADIVFLY